MFESQESKIENTRELTGSGIISSHNSLGEVRGESETESDSEMPVGIKPNNIIIHTMDYGYNVKIGCQIFAVESIDKLIDNIKAYLENPSETEKKWTKDKKLL